MNSLSIFANDEFGEVRVVNINNKPYFEGKAVAKILGYKNQIDALQRHCEKEGVVFHDRVIVTGKRRDGNDIVQTVKSAFIDEGNMYRLIIKSKKKEAKRFEKWVVEEVLPSIRKDGGYINNNSFVSNLIKLCEDQYEKLENLRLSLEDNKTYIDAGKTLVKSNSVISVGAFAKLLNGLGINIWRNRLFSYFRNNGYIMKQGNENQPKQK